MIFASRVFIKTLYNAFPIVGVNGKVKLIPVFRGDKVMNKKKNITYLIIGFIGVMLSVFGINMFNAYVLMSIPLIGRMIAMIVIYWFIMLIPIILMVCNKEKIYDIGFLKDKIIIQIVVGIGIGLVMSIVLTLIPHLAGLGEWVDNGHRYKYLWQFVYEFFYCIVAVGAAEEFVFRGYFYKKAKDVFGSDWWAVIISSVMFGLFHIFSGNIIQVFMTMFIGALFCMFRLKANHCTLLSLIIEHGVYDALITVFASALLV